MSDKVLCYGRNIINSDIFQKMNKFMQHRQTTTMEHSVNVAEKALDFVERHHIKCDEESLVIGCLLHDFFLYDYHDKGYKRKKLHAFRHPTIALENAEKYFDLNDTEREMIKKHMWPTTIVFPKRKETWIIVWADKTCAIRELLNLKAKYKIRQLKKRKA